MIGCLSKSERERRAREIIAESGADTVEHFNQVVNFREGARFGGARRQKA